MAPVDLVENQNPWWRDGAIRRAREYPVRRDLQPRVIEHIQRVEDRRALVLMGPRQVGKTVLLLQLADDLLDAGWPPQNLTYFDFSDERLTGGEAVTAREIVGLRPVGFDSAHPQAFLLDEIGSSPQWDRWLKQAVDERIGRIVVTDSAASLLREGSRESGQGRWDELYLEGLAFREFVRLHGSPDEWITATPPRVEILYGRYLSLGGFPEYTLSLTVPEALRRLRSDIAERAIERDLGRLGLDVQRIKDLFVYIVRESGGEFNVEDRASDLQADPRSVRDWISRLRDTLLISGLERFVPRSSAGLRAKTKWFAADPGLVLAFARLSPEDREVQAAVFEAAVFRHLREASRELDGQLNYFRHKDDLEIDFVFEASGDLIGLEVTSSQRLRPDKLTRLLKAGKILKAGRLILVYGGLTEAWVEGVHVLPLQKFLLDPGAFLRKIP